MLIPLKHTYCPNIEKIDTAVLQRNTSNDFNKQLIGRKLFSGAYYVLKQNIGANILIYLKLRHKYGEWQFMNSRTDNIAEMISKSRVSLIDSVIWEYWVACIGSVNVKLITLDMCKLGSFQYQTEYYSRSNVG